MARRTSTRQTRSQTRRAFSLSPRAQSTITGLSAHSGVPRFLQRQGTTPAGTTAASTGKTQVPSKSYTKQEYKLLLRDIIGLEWMHQSNAKSPLQLSAGLKSLIQMLTPLSDKDLSLLWDPQPKTPQAVLKQIDHSLPESITPSDMQKLQTIKQQAIMTQKIPVLPKPRQAEGKASKTETMAKQLKAEEKLIKLLLNALKGKKPEDKDQSTKIVKEVLKAFFKTKEGKKLKEKGLEILLGNNGLPFTLITVSGVLAAMMANNTNIPSTPEIDVSDSISLKFEFEGKFQQPKGFKIILKFSFGGPEKEKTKKQQAKVIPLPTQVYTEIAKLKREIIYKWLLDRAYWEYETAGPDQEQHEQEFYKYVKNNPDSMPDTQIVAEHVARQLLTHGMQNRIRQLKGESLVNIMNFDMKQQKIWNEFYTLKGLKPHFDKIVRCLVPVVPFKALGIKNVMFLCGKHYPISIVIRNSEEIQ